MRALPSFGEIGRVGGAAPEPILGPSKIGRSPIIWFLELTFLGERNESPGSR
jgi:hypothetical protein